jgi:mycofactocin system glycosyltransferase
VPPAWTGPERPDLAVVIPVKDDLAGLARTLEALEPTTGGTAGASGAVAEIVVVDDGSADPTAVAEAVEGRGCLVRRPRAGGPAEARRTGLATVTTPMVAFVDAGVEVSATDLARLVDHLADPAVAAVAPRVASLPGSGWLARYEEAYSPLDLGGRPAPVRVGSLVPYVPTACLVVRSAAVADVGGFDPALRYGEDVDLIWRLGDRGHAVRFDPTVQATHPPRPTLGRWVRQRFGYGRSAGPLARRHGTAVAPSRCSGWSLGLWALLVTGHPAVAAALGAWTLRALRPKLQALPDPTVEAIRLGLTGHWWAARNLSRQLVRVWWPLTVIAARWRLGRRLLLIGVAASLDAHRRPGRGSLGTTMALGLLDDLVYGAGVWVGLRPGSLAAVVPATAAWPPREGTARRVTER